MSVDFYLFNSLGEIVQTGSCYEDWLELQARPGLTVGVGLADMNCNYVDAEGSLQQIDPRPSIEHRLNRDLGKWEDMRDLGRVKQSALDEIDRVAGQARLRYITSVPGQAETYAKKEEQAKAWASSSFAGDPPSFIAAEAEALNVTPQSVAEEVIALADFWASVKGPQIEATRRKWKVALEGAQTPSDVDSMVEAARVELDAL